MKYNHYKTTPGSRSLLSLNFNNDSYTDLLLFSPDTKKSFLLEGDGSGSFQSSITTGFGHPSNKIRNISFGDVYSKLYISVSRKARTASVINFTKDGNILTLDEIKFNSYPEKIDIADVDLNQTPDVLVTGSGFDGISLLEIRNGLISENKIIKNNSFKDAVFADFNNDGFDDIAAVNLFRMVLDFYENNSRGTYRSSRSVPLETLPFTLSSTDLDLDYYDDITWSEDHRINILYGDFLSSYNYRTEIKTEYNPHILLNGDFNSDGNNDIVYADTLSGTVSVIFAKDKREFSEELILLRKKNISAVIPYYSKFIRGIAVLGSDGNLYTISQTGTLAGDVNIIAGLKPAALNYFDYLDNGITDLCYIDEDKTTINFIVRNSEGVPDKLYNCRLHFPHKEIIIDNYSKSIKHFYCWTRGQKLIEVITADFNKNKFTRASLYSSGNLYELAVKPKKDNPAVVYASYMNGNSAGADVFEFHNFRYSKINYNNFAYDVAGITPFIGKKDQGFFTWQKRKKLTFYSYDISNLSSARKIGEIDASDILISCTGDIFNNGSISQFAYVKNDNRTFAVTAGSRFNRIPVPDTIEIKENHQIWFGAEHPGGLNKIWVYLPEKASLNLITLFNKGKNLILSEIISGINVNRYFMRNMSILGYNIVYSDPEENCITIKHLE